MHQLGALVPPLLIHAPATWRRLGTSAIPAYDLLELFAFVAPGQPAVPTARGLAQALGLPLPGKGLENAAAALPVVAVALLRRLQAEAHLPANKDAAQLAMRMGRAGWNWGPLAAEALALAHAGASAGGNAAGRAGGGATAKDNNAFRVWRRLPEWEEQAPPAPPSALPVSSVEARARLAQLVGPDAEQRQGQADYASAAAAAFEPRHTEGAPHMVLAEAGTGTGKTLGYVAPASLWAERNHAPVWISTFTRHLQRQVETELERLFPDPAERRRRVVLRKGRENYLCLLNLEDAVTAALSGMSPALTTPLGLNRTLGGGDDGWRYSRRRPARLVHRDLRRAAARQPRRPARRVPLRRLHPLEALLRRARHPAGPRGRPRRRQPRPRPDPGRLGRAGRQLRPHPLRLR